MQLYRRPLCTRVYRRVGLGMFAVGLRNNLVAFQMALSSADRLVMYESKVAFGIDCSEARRRRVSVLYTLLSI